MKKINKSKPKSKKATVAFDVVRTNDGYCYVVSDGAYDGYGTIIRSFTMKIDASKSNVTDLGEF